MSREMTEYVQKRMVHAKKTVWEAGIQLENNLWNIAVNRLYYACFYAVTALLSHRGSDTRTHSGAQRLFNLHFVKPGLVSREFGELYSVLMDMRQDADYEDEVEYEEEDVRKLLPQVNSFIAEIERILLNPTQSN